MKRVVLLALLTPVAALGGLLPAASAASHATGGTKIDLENTAKFGKILDSSGGFTIYVFTRDSHNADKCQSISGCPSTWRAVLTKGKPVAGRGVMQSLLGTITLKNGKHQVTYNGHPLYTYSGDGSKHETSYVNFSQFGGHWPAINAAGNEVT